MKRVKKQKEQVIIRENDVLRRVNSIDETEKIISVLKANGMLGNGVVNTEIFSRDEKYVSHEKISPVIHSGEFTVSMAYDLFELALKTCTKMLDYGIYTWDFLPHNLTYTDGHWVLYDFGAFALSPENVKTQIRNMFKICFAALELLKIVDRAKLKRCFLNRISGLEFFKMVHWQVFFTFEFRKNLCLLLNILGLRRLTYRYLTQILETYTKDFSRKIYKTEFKNSKIYDTLNNILATSDIKTLFVTGKEGADWVLNNKNGKKTFVFVDDYDFTDEFYNLISSDTKYKNILTGVLYPLVDDREIPQCISYRALYDCFAQERMISDCAVFLNFEEIIKDNNLSLLNVCENLAGFYKKMIIFKIGQDDNLLENLKNILADNTNSFEVISIDGGYLIVCSGNNFESKIFEQSPQERYLNGNRHAECHMQSQEIIGIIKSCT